jgi:hypothetical protein
MQIKHCCADCGEVMAVHEHASYQEIKDCLAGMRALCAACRSWSGSPCANADAGTPLTQSLGLTTPRYTR